MAVRPAKTQINLVISPVWSESSLSAWRKLMSLSPHWAHSKDTDQTGQMPRLIWVFAGRTVILLVLSCHGSFSVTTSIGKAGFRFCLIQQYLIVISVTDWCKEVSSYTRCKTTLVHDVKVSIWRHYVNFWRLFLPNVSTSSSFVEAEL